MVEHYAVNNLKTYLDEVVMQYYKIKSKNFNLFNHQLCTINKNINICKVNC
jgi:hypothetical protein